MDAHERTTLISAARAVSGLPARDILTRGTGPQRNGSGNPMKSSNQPEWRAVIVFHKINNLPVNSELDIQRRFSSLPLSRRIVTIEILTT
jgi:hypothetical protein